MQSRCYVPKAWKTKMQFIPFELRDALLDGMRDGMKQVEKRAVRMARWNSDGTDTGKWYVTGTARKSIRGYVLGDNPNYESFNITDPKYGSMHVSPAANFGPLNNTQMVITGVLTMTEQHSAKLQDFEISGTRSGLSPLRPGQPVTQDAMTANKDFLWWCINRTARNRLKGIL
jgi:hypothetical protein